MRRFIRKDWHTAVRVIAAFALGATSFPGVALAAPPCTTRVAEAASVLDRHTTAEIERRIAGDDTLAPLAGRVHVTTSDGIVTLRGTVESQEDRLVLASVAEGTPGVRRVEDRLTVR